MKRVLSLLMSIVMLISITAGVDFSAYAESSGDFDYSVSGSTATITSYYGNATSVSIPSKIDGYTVTSIGDDAFSDCTSLTSVTIPNSVTSIGYAAFYNCTSLTSIIIPDIVTSIGNFSFSNCKSLISVTIPNSVTSISYGAFEYCTSLTSVTIPNSVTSIGDGAFEDCTSLSSVTIPNSVTSIGEAAFYYCTSLTSVTIPNSVTSICDDAFYLVNNIEYYGSASGSPWGAKSVNGYVDGYFVYRDSTKKELLGCSAQATSVTIPDSVTSIGDDAFYKCTSLTSVTIPNSITSIGDYAFRDCTSLTSVTIGNSVTSIGKSAFSYCSSLTSVTIGNSVTSIGSFAFYYCTNLTSVTIPDSVTSIGSDAFWNCTSLTSVTIPNSVTSIDDYAFYLVNNIEYHGSASGSPWGAKSVNGYVDGYLVYKDSTKKELLGCSAQATSVTIPDSTSSICEYAFAGCTSITSVTIPNSVTSIGKSAFDGCTSITSVTIPNSVTSIGGWAFAHCTSLTSVSIPNSLTSVGNCTFQNCKSLTSVMIPNSVTSIGDGAFEYCISLISVTIPNSVISIGDWAFYSCTSLTDVYYMGSQSEWNYIEIYSSYSSNECLLNATIHYNYSDSQCIHNLVIDEAIEPTCTDDGLSEGSHCSVCNEVIVEQKTVPATGKHNYKTTTTKATLSKNGSVLTKCSVCGSTKSNTTIYYPKTISLSATSYTYDGKVKTPSVKVVGSNGKAISSSNYTVSYASGRKYVGKYAVKITFKGNYSGSKTLYFTINPKGTSLSKITAAKKGFKVYWKKQSTQTTGYQIQYSTSSKFSNAKTVTLTKNSYTSKSISKLSAKKKYYVRIRTYKKVGSTYYYSSWSKAKYVTTKK